MTQVVAWAEEDTGITTFEVKRVLENVVITLTILFFAAMCIVGIILKDSCSSQPMLAVYMIIQGVSGPSMPILYIIKYRCQCGNQISRIIFLTSMITIAVVSIAWLIVGTHWMATAGCPGSDLYRAGIGFMVIMWSVVIIGSCVGGIKGLLHFTS